MVNSILKLEYFSKQIDNDPDRRFNVKVDNFDLKTANSFSHENPDLVAFYLIANYDDNMTYYAELINDHKDIIFNAFCKMNDRHNHTGFNLESVIKLCTFLLAFQKMALCFQ